MLFRLAFSGFLMLCSSYAKAQVTTTFFGLKSTKLSYLTNQIEELSKGSEDGVLFLTLNPRASFEDALETTRQNLVNLPAITKAAYEVTYGKDTLVSWQLEESRTLSPLVNIGGIKGNFNYLLGFKDIHFRGLGQTLTAYYQNNQGEHNYSLALTNPAYRGSRWGYRLENRRYAAIEPLYFSEATVDYRYSNLIVGLGASYAPKPRLIFNLGVDLFRENYQRMLAENAPEVGPESLIQRKIAIKAGHWFDRVNYYHEILDGFRWQTNVQFVRSFTDQTDFSIILHDLLYFLPLGSHGNLAARFRAGVSSNTASPFAPFFVDSQVNIRGSGNRIDRGTAQLVLNVEYRQTVFRDRRERYAAQIVAFSDLGNWRNPGGQLTELIESENLRHFIGGGIRLISNQARDAALRLDYGFDTRNDQERGFVLGFGQYF